MAIWARDFMNLMQDNSVDIWLAFSYVDDERFLSSIVPKGSRWEQSEGKWQLTVVEEQKVNDDNSGETDTARTARVLREAMNFLTPDVEFTTESCEDMRIIDCLL